MKANSSIILKCILVIYRLVLRCYPHPYREQYAELMLQAAKDQLRYSKQHAVNQIAFTLIKDISLSLPREHYAFESQQGFARKSFLLLLILLTGLFLAREPLQQITTTSIEAVIHIPDSFQTMREDKYLEDYQVTAHEMLHSQDPNSVVAGATTLIDMDWLHKMSTTDRTTIRVELLRAMTDGANDPAVLFNTMRICGNEPDICDVQPLLAKMRDQYPQNAMTWLRNAAVAKQRGDTDQQLAYLEQALVASTYRNYGKILTLKQIEKMQERPFVIPWYLKPFPTTTQYSPEALAMYLTINSGMNTIPSCEYYLQFKSIEVQSVCRKIALNLLKNQSLDFSERFFALELAKHSGDTAWLSMGERDQKMYKEFYSLSLDSRSKLPSLQETHDALAQGKVDALVKRIIAQNK